MARLLTDSDYLKVTLSNDVRDIINDHFNQWLDAEQAAQVEMASYLKQRYIVNQIFTDTSLFDSLRVYSAKNLIIYSESEYNDLTSYLVGDRISFNDYIYECIQAAQGISPDNTSFWVKRVLNNSLYFGTLPVNEWDKNTTYSSGDVVWYLDKKYTATVNNKNIEPTSNSGIWGSGVTYTIPAGLIPDIEYHDEITYSQFDVVTYKGNKYTYKNLLSASGHLPTDVNYWDLETTSYEWTYGDNRNPLIVRFLLDMTAYHFMRSVPARAIPDHIKEAYNGNSADDRGGALGWLKNIAKGNVSVDLPEIYATPLYSIMHGQSRDKQDNLLW